MFVSFTYMDDFEKRINAHRDSFERKKKSF